MDNEDIVNNFENIVNEMIKENLRLRKRYEDVKGNISLISYAIDLCTVNVDLGRRCGKTTYINKHATKQDLVVVSHRIQYPKPEWSNTNVCLLENVMTHSFRGRTFDNIYVDNSRLVFENNRSRVFDFYNELIRQPKELTFILFG